MRGELQSQSATGPAEACCLDDGYSDAARGCLLFRMPRPLAAQRIRLLFRFQGLETVS